MTSNLKFFENSYNLISTNLSQPQEDNIQSHIDNTSIDENFLGNVGVQTNNTILGDINSILILYVFSDTGSISKIPLIPNIQNTYFDKAINDKPTTVQSTDISLSSLCFKEYIPVETTIATLNTENLGGSTFVYSFASGSGDVHNNSFTISGSELKINAIPDYYTQHNYSIRIKSVEPRNCNILPFEKSFSLTVVSEPTDINLSVISFCENIDCRSIVATISTVDKDSTTFIYSLVSGQGDDDNSKFVIEDDKLLIKESPNFEVQSSYKVRIKSEDEKGNHYSKSFVLSVNDKLEFFETPYSLVQINLSEEQTNSITNIINSTEVTNFLETVGVQTNNTIIGETNSISNLYFFSDTRKTSRIPTIPNLQFIYLDRYVSEVPNNSLSNVNPSVKMNIENIDIDDIELDKITPVYSKLRYDIAKETVNKLQILKRGNKENIKSNFKNFFTQLRLNDNYSVKNRQEKRIIFKQAINNSMRVAKKECERKFKIDKEELLETVDIPQKVKERIDANGQEFTVIDKSQDENDIIMIFDEDNLGNFYSDIEDIGDLTVIKFFGTKVKIEKTSESENTVSILDVDEGSTQAQILDGNIVSETTNPTIKSGKWELSLFYGSVGGGTGEEQPEEETQQPGGDICFPAGTPVQTDQGEIAIEKLTSENTIDGVNVVAVVPVYNKCDYLVKINKHALGPNYPKKNTLISRNHRVYINKKRDETIPALALYNGKTVTVVQRGKHETIYNVLLPTHSKMTINGLVVETLHPKSVYAKK